LNAPWGIVASGGNLLVANGGGNVVSEYSATTGFTISANFISVPSPLGLALSGGNLYVGSFGTTQASNDSIGEYNATTGATINSALITGLNEPFGFALSGGNLFVDNSGNSTIGEYNATTGAAINKAFISSGLDSPEGIVVSSPSSVPDAGSTLALLLLGVAATFGLNLLLHRRSVA
jgi:VPDSG-CTERM motif